MLLNIIIFLIWKLVRMILYNLLCHKNQLVLKETLSSSSASIRFSFADPMLNLAFVLMARYAYLLTGTSNYKCTNRLWKSENAGTIIQMDTANLGSVAILDMKKMRNPVKRKTDINFTKYWTNTRILFSVHC